MCAVPPHTHSFYDWKEKELHHRVTVNEHLFSAPGTLPATYVSQIVTVMWSIFLPFDIIKCVTVCYHRAVQFYAV